MAEWFKESYRFEKLKITSGYVCKNLTTGAVETIAINLENPECEYGGGGQLTINEEEIRILYPLCRQYLSQRQLEGLLDGK